MQLGGHLSQAVVGQVQVAQGDEGVQQTAGQHVQPGAGQAERAQAGERRQSQLRVVVQHRQRVVRQVQLQQAGEVRQHLLEDRVNLQGADGCAVRLRESKPEV